MHGEATMTISSAYMVRQQLQSIACMVRQHWLSSACMGQQWLSSACMVRQQYSKNDSLSFGSRMTLCTPSNFIKRAIIYVLMHHLTLQPGISQTAVTKSCRTSITALAIVFYRYGCSFFKLLFTKQLLCSFVTILLSGVVGWINKTGCSILYNDTVIIWAIYSVSLS